MTVRRRQVLVALGTGLLLGGCGFRPIYSAGGPRGDVAALGLGQVSVAIIPNRAGQLLRQALQQRLDGAQSGRLKLYELSVGYGIAQDLIGIQQDSTYSRIRDSATASWTLKSLDVAPVVMASGVARQLDGANVIDQQYFAADLANETALARIADNIADQITTQLAAYFVHKGSAG